jgi:hypothetical protein
MSADGRTVFFTVERCPEGGSGVNAGVPVPVDALYARIGESQTVKISEHSPGDCTGVCLSSCVLLTRVVPRVPRGSLSRSRWRRRVSSGRSFRWCTAVSSRGDPSRWPPPGSLTRGRSRSCSRVYRRLGSFITRVLGTPRAPPTRGCSPRAGSGLSTPSAYRPPPAEMRPAARAAARVQPALSCGRASARTKSSSCAVVQHSNAVQYCSYAAITESP